MQLTSQKVVDHIVRAEKNVISSCLLILSFFFQTRKKKKKCKFIYFEQHVSQVSVFDKTNITLNKNNLQVFPFIQ